MKKILKLLTICTLAIMLCFPMVACGEKTSGSENGAGEKVKLETIVVNEVEFENSDNVKLTQDGNIVTISGKIDAMSKSQKNAYGVDDVTHVVAIKFTFDRERTLSSFKLKGDVTKVYSDDANVENYSGKLTDLLDNEAGEDSYCELLLSANTEEYSLISKYTDGTESTIKIKIVATLSTATSD